MIRDLPKKGSSADKVLMYLLKNEPQTLTMLQSRTGVKRDVLENILRDYKCTNSQFGWCLSASVCAEYEELYPKSAIAQPRCTTILTPEMTGYEKGFREIMNRRRPA